MKKPVGKVVPWRGWQIQRKLYVMGSDPWFLRVYRTRKEAVEAWPSHFQVGVVKLVRVEVRRAE